MPGLFRSVIGPSAALTLLLTGLSVAAPVYNGQKIAPRSVFLQLPDTVPQPELSVVAIALPDGRWRLALDVTHFQFTDLCLPQAEAIPVGHAHVMVDGEKLASAYQPVVELGPLPSGGHDLRVVLRGQDHRALLGRNGLIEARVRIHVP